MMQPRYLSIAIVAFLLAAIPGCGLWKSGKSVQEDLDLVQYQYAATQIDYPSLESSTDLECTTVPAPLTIDMFSGEQSKSLQYEDLKLQDAIRRALVNSPLLKDVGGLVLDSPDNIVTVQDPAIQETDPRFGIAAALSAFDASFAHSTFVEYNDRQLNNTFFGGGTRSLQQDLSVHQTQISKRGATGTEFSLTNNTDYDRNNAPGNQFPSAWNTNIEAEVRHPLLQGGGVEFNRIAGDSETPGVLSGVVIARLNVDMSLTDFEVAVRDFVSNVENAYWDLYFGYRDLDSKIQARDDALRTWNLVNALNQAKRRGGTTQAEARARAEYYRFQEQVQNALTGRLQEGTRTNNGSRGGTFRAIGGVYLAERRLRLLMGEPANQVTANGSRQMVLFRPSTEPIQAKVEFKWEDSLIEAMTRRAELRRQKWKITRREKELQANCKFLLPNLDLIGRYRWRGFGRDLTRQGTGRSKSALEDLVDGDFQEWQLGLEFSYPFGRRQAHAAVRNSELLLARERTILRGQEQQIVHDLSNAISEVDRAHAVLKTNYNRMRAANTEYTTLNGLFEEALEQVQLNDVLDSHQRLVDAQVQYYRVWAEYAIAVKNVHFEKGSMLDYDEVYLTEGLWPVKAYHDAAERHYSRTGSWWLDKIVTQPWPISDGEYPQLIDPVDGEAPAIDEFPNSNQIPASDDAGRIQINDGLTRLPDLQSVFPEDEPGRIQPRDDESAEFFETQPHPTDARRLPEETSQLERIPTFQPVEFISNESSRVIHADGTDEDLGRYPVINAGGTAPRLPFDR